MNSHALRALAVTVLVALSVFVSASAATALDIVVADLAGVAIEAEIFRDQLVQRAGRSFNVQVKQTWDIQVGEDHQTLTTKAGTTATSPRGTQTAKPNIGSFLLGQARPVPSRGGGTAMWNFADATLTFTRTFPSGAYRAHFALARGPDGWTCTAAEAFARENGSKPIRLQSAFGDGELILISAKQVGARCKIVKPG
jgi:hypothetical protein